MRKLATQDADSNVDLSKSLTGLGKYGGPTEPLFQTDSVQAMITSGLNRKSTSGAMFDEAQIAVRFFAVEMLSGSRDPRAINALVRIILDPEESVRFKIDCVRALSNGIEVPKVVKCLTSIVETVGTSSLGSKRHSEADHGVWLKQAALEVLGKSSSPKIVDMILTKFALGDNLKLSDTARTILKERDFPGLAEAIHEKLQDNLETLERGYQILGGHSSRLDDEFFSEVSHNIDWLVALKATSAIDTLTQIQELCLGSPSSSAEEAITLLRRVRPRQAAR